MGRLKKYLDQKLVDEFAKTRALEKKIDDWLEAVREIFMEDLQDGALCPTAGPYLIAIEKGSQSAVDWKGELFRWISNMYFSDDSTDRRESDKQAAETIAKIEKKTKRKKFSRVVVKTNPAFAHDISKQVLDHLGAVGVRERRKRPRAA